MIAFTPGPWLIGKRKDGTKWFSLGNPVTGPHNQADIDCSDEDARLIAAAPEMYAALKAHDQYMLDAGYESPKYLALHPAAAENWSRIRALLTKIDGDV